MRESRAESEGANGDAEPAAVPLSVEAKIARTLVRSGYPLQAQSGHRLRAQGFHVMPEWGYLDGDIARSMDLFAFKTYSAGQRFPLVVDLLVECKRSDRPVVFIHDTFDRGQLNFPKVSGHNEDVTVRTADQKALAMPIYDYLSMGIHPFFTMPPVAANFSRAEWKSGDIVINEDTFFNDVVMPLVKASTFYQGKHRARPWTDADPQGTKRGNIELIFPLAVLHAPMFLASVDSEEPQVDPVTWVRVVRHETSTERPAPNLLHALDVVHADFLDEYIAEHLEPYVAEIAARAHQTENALGGQWPEIDIPVTFPIDSMELWRVSGAADMGNE